MQEAKRSVPEYVGKPGSGTGVKPRQEEKLEQPHKYKVLLHNDHYTSMDFVVEVLETVFHKSSKDAVSVMLKVHQNGTGLAGVYIKAVAEAKVEETHERARQRGYPLMCSMERE
jgi:ATP-dependent Clp protease adaptor protein ClpS